MRDNSSKQIVFNEKTITIKVLDSYQEIYDSLVYYKDKLHSLDSGMVKAHTLAKKYEMNASVVALSDNNKRVGFSAFYNNDGNTHQAYISTIAIASDYEGQGYGSLLLSIVEKLCIETGMKRILLETGKTNNRARNFYTKNGYIENGQSHENTIYYYKVLDKDSKL